MIDEERVQWMAMRYEMNPPMAMKLLEMARAEPAIVRMSRKYDELMEGDTVGNQDDQKASGQLPENQKRNPYAGGRAS